MKNKLILLGVALLMATSCQDFEETNTNPNQATTSPPEYLLTQAQEVMLDQLYDGFDNSRIGMTLAQYWSQNQYTDESRYLYRPQTNNTTWNNFYTSINNLQEIIRLNEADEAGRNDNQIAVARIMKAWAFHTLTDIYGDIPYLEAANAVGDNFSPTYTPQQEIYTNLLKELTEAQAQLDVAGEGFDGGDLIYGSDLTKWKKFANSLKLRVAIRMADRMPAEAATAISEAVAAGVFTSNDDNAAIQYLASQPNTNPLYVDVVVGGRIDYSASNILVGQLQQRNDPRLESYFEPAVTSGTFIGRPFGQNSNQANAQNADDVSQLSETILAPDFEGMLMDYAEVNFILSEAVVRGALAGDPAAYYAQGITASMNYWGITNAGAINAYIQANPLNVANYKQTLGIQKWIALYMQGFQGWAEYRRLDFGILQFPPVGGVLNSSVTRIPLRRVYPPLEQTLNGENYRTALDRQFSGDDSFVMPLWWDVN